MADLCYSSSEIRSSNSFSNIAPLRELPMFDVSS
jgi:hypothetical protein